MKKILAIILCATLVIGMLPAVFATTTGEETETLEYVFSKTATGGNATATYENVLAAGVSPDKWALVGASWYQGSSLATDLWYSAATTTRVGSQAVGFAVKIYVDTPGTYIPTVSYLKSKYGAIFDMYVLDSKDVPSTWNMEEFGSKSTGAAFAIEDYNKNTVNSVVKKVITAKNTYEKDTGENASVYNEEELDYVKGVPVEFDEVGDYYVIFGISGADTQAETINSVYYLRLSGLKFTPDKTHTFNIDTGAMTVAAAAAATAAYDNSDKSTGLVSGTLRPGTGLQFINELSEIDEADSNRWALRYKAPAEDGTPSVQDTAALTIGKRGNASGSAVINAIYRYGTDHIDAKLALLLEISYAGKYNLAVNGTKSTVGTAADVYMIPEADVLANNDTISLSFIKTYAPVGRLDTKGEDVAASFDIGTVELEKGNYYIIFVFNSNSTSVNNKGNHYFYLSNIVLTEDESEDVVITPDQMTQNELSFAVNANVAGAEVTADITDYEQGLVAEVSRGKTIKLEAKPLEGYEFAGWKRGGVEDDARGIYLDKSASFDYKIMTNTYLTAVYVEKKATAEGTKAVEFWNEYGTFFARNEEKDGFISVPDASLTGYIFDAWYADGTDALAVENSKIDVSALSSAVTRAMAKYSGTAAVSGYAVANGSTTDYQAARKFGDPVSSTDAAATCWRRDGKIVAYDVDTYTHYVWDATQILSSYEPITDKTPIVVLEDTAIDGARMIEYDRGDTSKYEICEVGILFGSQDDMVISSCEHKATSQKNSNHGQFSAAPLDEDHTYARGYMIYKNINTGVYHVIYAD